MPIHTFSTELPSMKKKEYWLARNQIFKLCQLQINELPICKIHGVTKGLNRIYFHFPDHPGISLTLSKKPFPNLEMRINPSITEGYSYDSLCTFDEEIFCDCEMHVNRILDLLQFRYRFRDMRLKRCDCTMDIDLDSECSVEELLNCIRKSKLAYGYQPVCFDETHQNWREKNRHSFRVTCGDAELTAYDKSFQLTEEGLMPEELIPENRLRLEVSMTAHALHRNLNKYEKSQPPKSCEEKLQWCSDRSTELLKDYFGRVLMTGEYLGLEEAIQRILESHYHPKQKKEMIDFLLLVRKKWRKGIPGAISEFQKAYSMNQINGLLDRFKQLNLNPATFSDSCTQKRVPSLVELVDKKAAVPY